MSGIDDYHGHLMAQKDARIRELESLVSDLRIALAMETAHACDLAAALHRQPEECSPPAVLVYEYETKAASPARLTEIL